MGNYDRIVRVLHNAIIISAAGRGQAGKNGGEHENGA